VADNTTGNESITEIVPKALAAYLKTNVTGLAETYDEFPSPNLKILMPSISVFASTNAQFRSLMPYVEKQAGSSGGPAIASNKAKIRWVTGIYDFNLQLDIWARNKEERDDTFDALFNALNPNINPMGLVLRLDEYFNQLCSYEYVGHTMQDSGERADRDEWRMTVNVLVTCKAIRERSEFIITDPDTAQEIEDTSQIDRTVVVVE
jgi:hypothetical protein